MICNIQQNFAFIELPEMLFDYDKLSSIVNYYKITHIGDTKVKRYKANIIVEIYGDDDASLLVRKIFSSYHNIDINFLDMNIKFNNSNNPLVSCIILLNSNYDFVNELTIPSIIFNSKNVPIEIIVVHNGENSNYNFSESIKVIESEKSNIPKAYNKGVNMCKGKYIALFHDDCFLSDDKWVDKSINVLDNNIIAVGPEYHEFKSNEDYLMRKDTDKRLEFSRNEDGGFLKEVPLVMDRSKFLELGGFPDDEILGQEDIFLHKNILQSGRKNLKVDIKNYHFEGISTLSLFSNKQNLIQILCNHFIFSKEYLIGMIRYGLGRSITERIDYCTTIFRNDIYDEEFSPFCEEVANLGNHKNLDSMTKKHRKENDKVKKFIDGAVKTFVTVSDNKSLDILKDFVDFNEILINYITNRVLFNYERKDKFKYL
jgi:hypothetical protein